MIMKNKVKEIFTWKNKTFLIILLITASTLAVYAQVGLHQFINFDDDLYITSNDQVKAGLTWQGFLYAFGFSHVTYWHPLTWLSHMLDCQIFGLNAGMHHLMNLVFHIMNSLLLFIVLMKMTGSHWRSAFAAALFALHPVNVDTVAWVAERKNVLSTFFWMLTMLAYFSYIKNPRISKYIAVVFIFVLGLLSKPMLVTLPFVLLLFDYWPLQRFQLILNEPGADPKNKITTRLRYQGVAFSRLIAEKVPLLIFALVVIVISSQSIRYGGFQITTARVPMGLRIENAIVSYVLYLGKMIWSSNLTFYYPYPDFVPIWQVIGAVILLILITFIAVRFVFRSPYFLIGWLWFLGTLVPVSGIMQGGLWPEIAERWAYVPYIGLFIAVSWGAHDIFRSRQWGRRAFSISAATVLVILMALTWRQAGFWKNDFTLFTYGVKVNPNNFPAQNNLGNYYVSKKMYKEAAYCYNEVLRINPNDVRGLENMGLLCYDIGDKKRAIYYYSQALRYNPNSIKSNFKLGTIYSEQGDIDKAFGYFSRVTNLDPKHAEAYYNLGVITAKKGDKEKAIQYLLTAIKYNPRGAEARSSLGVILMNMGKVHDALQQFNEALKNDPKNKDARAYLTLALNYRKKMDTDIAILEQKIGKEPDNAGLLQKLAVLYSMSGNNTKALDALQRFVRIQPDNPDGYYNIACVYAKEGKVDDSIRWLTRSIDKGFRNWNLLQKDQDLNSIRNTSYYKDLMNKRG